MAKTRQQESNARANMRDKRDKAAVVKALGKTKEKLTVKELRALYSALKQKTDPKIPTKRADVLTRLTEWERREGTTVE